MPDIGVSKDALRAVVGLSGEFVGTTDSATITTKTINTTDNTLTATSQAAGDILVNNATKFIRRAIGAAEKPLKVNSGATDLEYATLKVAGGGTGVATLTGIVKASGTSNMTAVAAPTGTILGDSDTQNITGGKTFFDQTLKLRNPANTFSAQVWNPDVTSDIIVDLFNSFARYQVYQDSRDSKYKVKSGRRGQIDGSYTNPEDAIAFALAVGSYTLIEIRDGDYPIAATSGTLFNVNLNQHIRMSKGARIQVPQGSTSKVFSFNDPTVGLYSSLDGGTIEELGTPARLWTGVELNATSAVGIAFSKISNVRMNNPGTGVLLKCDGSTSFVNSNTLENLEINDPIIGIDFQLANSGTLINGNHFRNIAINSGTHILYGVKNITGVANLFADVKPWDVQLGGGSAISSNFLSTATKNIIIGGFMTTQNWSDLSSPLANHYIDPYGIGTLIPHSQTTRYWGHDDPEIEKSGSWSGTSTTVGIAGARGLLNGKLNVYGPTITQTQDSTGVFTRFTTGTTVNTVTGLYLAPISERDHNARFRIKFKISSAAQIRFAILFHSNSATAPVTGADPLANFSGAGLLFDSTAHANWRYYSNDGSASPPAKTNPGVAADALVHTLEVKAVTATPAFQFSLDNVALASLTTQIPAAGTDLGAYCYIENLTGGISKDLDLYWIKWRQDF
jgi:hypothetical protein